MGRDAEPAGDRFNGCTVAGPLGLRKMRTATYSFARISSSARLERMTG